MNLIRTNQRKFIQQQALPWYLKEDLPSKEFCRLKHQVKALISRNILGRQEIENFIKLKGNTVLKKGRKRVKDTGVFQRMTKRYKQLFAEENVEIKSFDSSQFTALDRKIQKRSERQAALRSLIQSTSS